MKRQKLSKSMIPERYQHPLAVLVIFISLIIFFHEIVIDGNVFVSADSIASKSYETLLNDAKTDGIFPLWNPYIFCGMPGYASLTFSGDRLYDLSTEILGLFAKYFGVIINSPTLGWELFYYFLLGMGVYFFAYDKLKNKVAALVSALGVMHSTYIAMFIMIGHMTKIPVLAFFPYVFLILERLRTKFNFLLSFILIIAVHFMLLPAHVQMIFYCYAALGIYYLFYLVRAIIKKESWKEIALSGLTLIVATSLAVGMTGDEYLSTLEYSKYSMRGTGPIVQTVTSHSEAGSNGGLDYNYATQWSFSPQETFTFLIPSLYGFGSTEYQGILSGNRPDRKNFYFGQQPFTEAPEYMGIVILILGIIGFWRNRKEPFVQYLGIVVALALLLSYGSEFPVFYNLMFYYFPMFNKFRIPSMALTLVQIFVPILAGYGVVTLIESSPDMKQARTWRYSLGGLAVVLVLSVIAKDLIVSIYSIFIPEQTVANRFFPNGRANEVVVNAIYSFVSQLVVTDVLFGTLFLLLCFGAFYLFWKKKLQIQTLVVVIIVSVLADLWRVNFQPMETRPPTIHDSAFSTPSYVSFLQQDTTLYRTLEFENGQPPYSNSLAYWRIQSAYGYHGAKMRQIQDMFDVVGLNNPLLWGLMDVKYIISDTKDSNKVLQPIFAGNGMYVLYNRAVLPRTFFINSYKVASGIDILQKIKTMSFDPTDVAYMMDDPKIKIDPAGTGAHATYVHYGIQDLEIHATATGNNLLFLSESWYPEGWKAFIDGKETPIYRLDYIFRGIVVPPGDHIITMEFKPSAYYIGKTLVLWINVLAVGGVLVFGFIEFGKKKQTDS